jgi:hypothetical protein
LNQPGRILLKEVPVKFTVESKKRLKKGILFIFNDIYVIAQESKERTSYSPLLKIVATLPIDQTSLQADVECISLSLPLASLSLSLSSLCFLWISLAQLT